MSPPLSISNGIELISSFDDFSLKFLIIVLNNFQLIVGKEVKVAKFVRLVGR